MNTMKQFSIDNSSYELDRTLSHRTNGTVSSCSRRFQIAIFKLLKKKKDVIDIYYLHTHNTAIYSHCKTAVMWQYTAIECVNKIFYHHFYENTHSNRSHQNRETYCTHKKSLKK